LSAAGVLDSPAEQASARRGELLARIPRAAWTCALIAFLNASCWSLVTYAFQAPDEPAHFAYVRELAEGTVLPKPDGQMPSEEALALEALHYERIRGEPQEHAIFSAGEQSELQSRLAAAASAPETTDPGAGLAGSEPPLYYAIEAVPYEIARGAGLLTRLQLMRLTSALMAGLTALFACLFVREALPASPAWAWTVGGMAVALAPVLGSSSGAINPDALLFAVSAALFYALARAFRRGLDRRGGVALGAIVALGLLTKVNFVGLVPGALLGLVLLTVRARRAGERSAYATLALALGLALSPALLYAAANALLGRPLLGIVSQALDTLHGSPLSELDYIWQFYLPRIPGTVADFPGLDMARQVWFRGWVGLYGSLDTSFPGWVYSFALIPAGAIGLLCLAGLTRARRALRARAAELAVYACVAGGVLVLTAADSYHEFPALDAAYAQVRYLLPLLPLLGAALALAALGAGRRLGPIAGTLIVMLFLAHDLFSQLLVVTRYYG
jgi:4-amino-4-deoxy-L-arabinose transferase-like glycosyltransferase